MKLQGKGALVTGASRGLGAALGAELARRGSRVALSARGRPALERMVGALRATGGEAHGIVADQGDEQAVHPTAESAAALVGPIDLLVLNASTLGPTPLRELSETECEDFEEVLQVNVLGPFRLAKAVLGSMIVRGSGLVVGITSDAGVTGYPGWGAYGVSKAALDHLLRTWAVELADTGVRFLSIDPGEMDTAMHAEAMPEADRSALARPADVARRIADLMEALDERPGPVRVDASGHAA